MMQLVKVLHDCDERIFHSLFVGVMKFFFFFDTYFIVTSPMGLFRNNYYKLQYN